MKQFVILILAICSFGHIRAQIDSSKVIHDSILANKVKYIGQPLNVLFNDIDVLIRFSDPDNMGSLKKGSAYYQKFIIFLPWSIGRYGSQDFQVSIANKVTVDRAAIISWRENGTFEKKIKSLLKNQIVVSLE